MTTQHVANLSAWKRGATARVLGHRGARREAPENSLLAFQRALDLGAVGVELDVRLGKSGVVLVLHDTTLSRVTEGRDARAAESLSLDDLPGTDLGQGQRVPTLLEVLTWAKETQALVNIELKQDVSDRRALVWGTVSALETTRVPKEQILFSSFHWPTLRALTKALPTVPRGYLFEAAWRSMAPLLNLAEADAVHPRFDLISERRLAGWRQRTTVVNTWTVNDTAVAQKLNRWGVDTLISDVPGEILKGISSPS